MTFSFVLDVEFLVFLVFEDETFLFALLIIALVLSSFSGFIFLLLPLVFRPPVLEPYFNLSFREIESLGELLPLGAHHVLVLLEGLLELEELARAERRPDPLGLPEGQQEGGEIVAAGEAWREDSAVATQQPRVEWVITGSWGRWQRRPQLWHLALCEEGVVHEGRRDVWVHGVASEGEQLRGMHAGAGEVGWRERRGTCGRRGGLLVILGVGDRGESALRGGRQRRSVGVFDSVVSGLLDAEELFLEQLIPQLVPEVLFSGEEEVPGQVETGLPQNLLVRKSVWQLGEPRCGRGDGRPLLISASHQRFYGKTKTWACGHHGRWRLWHHQVWVH